MSRLFRFKQFSVDDSGAAMKVGTDAVLLGCLAEQTKVVRALDIGTGSGLIALMLAQRFGAAQIEAVELDEQAAAQAANNFEASIWKQRLTLYQADITQWHTANSYDLICCNPPFYENGYKIEDTARLLARQQQSLTYQQLAVQFARLLHAQGSAWVVIPVGALAGWEAAVRSNGLHLQQLTYIVPKQGKTANRVIVAASKKAQRNLTTTELCIRNTANQYTAAYLALTRDYYLFA